MRGSAHEWAEASDEPSGTLLLRHVFKCFGENLLGVDLPYRGFLSCASGYLEKANRLERLTAGAGASPLTNMLTHGLMVKFGDNATVTQQIRRFYFRGENAYYGSSRPSMFRGRQTRMAPFGILVARLRLDEAGRFPPGRGL